MKSKRILELDALRGLAAIAVVLFHFTYRYQELQQFTQEPPFLFRMGYLGVSMFFVVSGFVIFMTIERTEQPMDFVFARFSRLYPTFWAAIIATTLIVLISQFPGAQRTPFEIAVNLTMLQEFFDVSSVEGVYWTLTRELIFYGWVLVALSAGMIRHWVPIAYSWLGLQLVAILSKHFYGWFPWKIEFYLLLEYCHLFVAGIAFYQLYRGRQSLAAYGMLGFAITNQFLLFERALPASRFEEGICLLMFFAVMWSIVQNKAGILAAKPLVFLGTISYAMYLTHQLLGYSIIRELDSAGWATWASVSVAIAASVALATAITWYIEIPALAGLRTAYKSWKQRSRGIEVSVAAETVAPVISEAMPEASRQGDLATNQRIDLPETPEGKPARPEKTPKRRPKSAS